jgi:putative Mn2+ efflux pump MntP
MSLLAMVLIAVGLAMDAFAVSVAEGIAIRNVTHAHTARVALHFGLFQALMPVLGWLAGASLRSAVGPFDHWVAFGLLMLIGGKMIADTFTGFETGEPREPSTGARLLLLAFATSIDALAVGVSLAMLRVNVWEPAIVIGVVTGVLCAIGIRLGDRVGARLEHRAELMGGLVLCLIGTWILMEHLLGAE